MFDIFELAIGLLLACQARAEVTFEIDPASFPLYLQETVAPQVDAVLLDVATSQTYELDAQVFGPVGSPERYFAVFSYDMVFLNAAFFQELGLTLECNEYPSRYVNYYELGQLVYLPGQSMPILETFPIHVLDICPPYSLDSEVYVFQGHSYSLFASNENWTWDEVRRIAHAKSAEVASIGSEIENQYLHGLLQDRPAWIGLTRESGIWSWGNSEPMAYDNWATGYPDMQDGSARYTKMELDGTWTNMNFEGNQVPGHLLLEWPFEWPIEIDDLVIQTHGPIVTLSWTVSEHAAPEQVYSLHFASDPWFVPNENTFFMSVTGSEVSFRLVDLTANQGWFRLVVDSAEEQSSE
ncbi:MAG: C-type lectin domain-containing protein [Calditrichaeota bacterium]|nr:C-type lectin domain-containing protein [Calditrichota bacterium]